MSDRRRADDVYGALLHRQGEAWVEPRLERTRRVLDLLDNPQRTYRVVHVTGTNGKTSTSRMIESLLRAHGLRTGLFTSPHLERFTERIVIDGEPITDAAIADAWDEIAPVAAVVDTQLRDAGEAPLTFFELLTVLAFIAFADAPVDVAVIEVGMGGSWDATNTADGDVAVIAPIGMDHADRLGDTPAAIARVKAGIIKPGAVVVSAVQEPEVGEVLDEAAAAAGTVVAYEGGSFGVASRRLAVGGQVLDVRSRGGAYRDLYLPLYGAHQGRNAALAVAAVEGLLANPGEALATDVVSDGLARVTSPGRLQLIGTTPTVLVDAAHNPHGVRALVTALQDSFDFDEWAVVLGVLADKDAGAILDALLPLPGRIFATAPESDRARDPDDLADFAEERGMPVSVHPDLTDAADAARAWAASVPRRAVVIAGSVVLAGEAITLAREQEWKAEGQT